jgi:hypothetical protein
MSKVRLGPFSEIQYSKIKDAIVGAGGSVERFNDSRLRDDFYKNRNARGISAYPEYKGMPEFIFVEVDKEFLLLIKMDLEKMGMPLVTSEAPPVVDEFLCPLCRYVSAEPGLCPIHKVPLLDFSTWVEFKRTRGEKGGRAFGVILFVIAVLVLGAVTYKIARDILAKPAVIDGP